MIGTFLEKILGSKDLVKKIETFSCKSDCQRCGQCVNLASELGLEISAAEMNAARLEFISGTLVADGVSYKPDPRRMLQSKIKRSINALLAGISKQSTQDIQDPHPGTMSDPK